MYSPASLLPLPPPLLGMVMVCTPPSLWMCGGWVWI